MASLQLSYDSRRDSVPTILLLMQRKLYPQGGLQAEGIFRINVENSQDWRLKPYTEWIEASTCIPGDNGSREE
ncbi:hypothetical protein NL676_014202 [Syzygium grande]|nr:hypothetical protein NL676_014202 [Syzygium grande]